MTKKKGETVFQRKNAVHSIAGQVHQVSIRKALQEGDEVAFPWALLLQSTRGGLQIRQTDCTSTTQKHSWFTAHPPVAMRAKRRQRIQLICFGIERSFFSIPGTRKNRNNLIQTKNNHFQCYYKTFNVEISCGDSPSSVIDTDPEGRTECNPER